VTAVAEVPIELAEYLEELVRRLAAVIDLDAVYLFGSAAQEAYGGAAHAAARARIWRETGEWVSKAEARRRA
jgi:hypothetical protein